MRNSRKPKRIDIAMSNSVIKSLESNFDTVTLVNFITTHFEVIARSSKTLKEIHTMLTEAGVDAGTVESFRVTYYIVKKRRDNANNTKRAKAVEKNNTVTEEPQAKIATDTQTNTEEKQKRHPSLGPPLAKLKDGREIRITEYGAKEFDI